MLAYLGAIFVLAGVGVFISFNWAAINSAARIVITLGSGLAIFVMALLTMHDENRGLLERRYSDRGRAAARGHPGHDR